ncbi:hypothetical protein [Streptomyces sp. NPDC055189]
MAALGARDGVTAGVPLPSCMARERCTDRGTGTSLPELCTSGFRGRWSPTAGAPLPPRLPGAAARCTGKGEATGACLGRRADGSPVPPTPVTGPPDVTPPGRPVDGASDAPGAAARCTSRNGATGIARADGGGDAGVQGAARPAPSSPVTGRAVSLRLPDDEEKAEESRLLDDASSRTPVRDDVSANEGFCHVDSRMPNAESATADPPSCTARWIGGSPDHAPGSAAALLDAAPDCASDAESVADGAAAAAPSSASAPPPTSARSPRPRSRSKNPTPQPSAPASVTKDAIWSA